MIEQIKDRVYDFIQLNPFKAIGIAAVVGFVLGLVL